MNKELKDWWGNSALDYGSLKELMKKYPDKIFATVANKPFGDSYFLAIYDPDEYEKAEEYLNKYRNIMKKKGITAYGVGISSGSKLFAERLDGFQGGDIF